MANSPEPLRTLKITLAYDGREFAGWQSQPELRTVQDEFEAAWKRITGEELRVNASGRTDAGVHALGQVVSLVTLSDVVGEKLLRGLNAVLPNDIVVCSVEEAPTGFHATYDALQKTYRYRIHNSSIRPLFDRPYVWHVPRPRLDEAAMGQGAQRLVGRHDFASYSSTGSERASTIRTIFALEVQRAGDEITIDVTGDGFLYNMVRAIAGALVLVGRGSRPPEWIAEALAARDRRKSGPTAPAQGLTLLEVRYPDGSDILRRR